MIKRIITNLLPASWLSAYHLVLSLLASFIYQNPSQKLVVIGVTGTKGKSSTTNFISQYLEALGFKTGFASTVSFKIDKKTWLNDQKMTMLGRFKTQRFLRDLVKAGCQYAIIETSSQGIKQYRHLGINYDVALFTNLTPEHIEAHGGFENYRASKEKLFTHLTKRPPKKINGQTIKKVIVANADDQEINRLKSFKADRFFTFGFQNQSDLSGSNLAMKNNLVEFYANNRLLKTKLFGLVNGYNALAALATIKALDLDFDKALDFELQPVPGRQEWVDISQPFKVMVDYAYEPVSLEKLYQDLHGLKMNRYIAVLGGTGGGRDKARQPIMGEIAAKYNDYVIVTNDDPYDDDPETIADRLIEGASEQGKILNENIFKILDRKQAINKALSLAGENDLVIITGKGAEQFICMADGKKIIHDDRAAVREQIQLITKTP